MTDQRCIICHDDEPPLLSAAPFFRDCQCRANQFHVFCFLFWVAHGILSNPHDELRCPLCRRPSHWSTSTFHIWLRRCVRAAQLIVPLNVTLGLCTLLITGVWPRPASDIFLLFVVVCTLTSCGFLCWPYDHAPPWSWRVGGPLLSNVCFQAAGWWCLGTGLVRRLFLDSSAS